jgi:hypothetical protein
MGQLVSVNVELVKSHSATEEEDRSIFGFIAKEVEVRKILIRRYGLFRKSKV